MALLLPNDDNLLPGIVICVECATKTRPDGTAPGRVLHEFRAGHAVAARIEAGQWTREKRLDFTEPAEFWKWVNYVRHSKRPVWIFARRLFAQLTWLDFWSRMESQEFSLHRRGRVDVPASYSEHLQRILRRTTTGFLVTSDPPSILVCYHRDRWRLTGLDLMNYIECGLKDVAALVDIGWQEWPDDTSPAATWQWCCYARCEVLREAVRRLVTWHAEQELGRWGCSTAGIALASFRHRWMMHDIYTPDEQHERDWERKGYFNGRVQALWAGKMEGNSFSPVQGKRASTLFRDQPPPGPYYLLDARSFYGAICFAEHLPTRCVESHISYEHNEDDPGPPYTDVMADVELDTPQEVYPVRHIDRTLYATGQYRTVLAGPELARAVKQGHVVNWLAWRRYTLAPCLHDYARDLWEQRVTAEQRDDKWIASVVKALLSKLHGKFLQKSKRWQDQPKIVPVAAWERWVEVDGTTGESANYRSIAWDVQVEVDAGDAAHCFPAIAAWVTSYGREWIRYWIRLAGPRNVLYVSTDSLLTTAAGYESLKAAGIVAQEGIGSLRLLTTADSLDIRGANNYRIGDQIITSGHPCNRDEWERRRVRMDRYERCEHTLAHHGRPAVASEVSYLDCRTSYLQGEVDGSGWVTPPRLTLGEQNGSAAATRWWYDRLAINDVAGQHAVDMGNE